MGSLTRMVLFAYFMSLLAVTQGQPFVQVGVPGVQDRPNSDATAAIDVYSSGSELENGLAAIMFPIHSSPFPQATFAPVEFGLPQWSLLRLFWI